MEYLPQPHVSKALGIPDRETMLRGINARRFHGLPPESVVSAFRGDPSLSFPERTKPGDFGHHLDYGHPIFGEHMGIFTSPMTLDDLTPKDVADFMEERTEDFNNYKSLPKIDRNEILARLNVVEKGAIDKVRKAIAL